jgi:hypothetical protein
MRTDDDWWEYANKLTNERDALAARLAEAERERDLLASQLDYTLKAFGIRATDSADVTL